MKRELKDGCVFEGWSEIGEVAEIIPMKRELKVSSVSIIGFGIGFVAEIIPMKRELKEAELLSMVGKMPCCRDNPYEEGTERRSNFKKSLSVG